MTTKPKPIEIEPHVLIYAFRYALGRDTGAVKDVAQTIIRNRDRISANHRKILIMEIQFAIKEDKAGGSAAREKWRTVVEVLRNHDHKEK